ncbi:hypothetical protein J6590_073206, partial [Homalodisca vitripennis]
MHLSSFYELESRTADARRNGVVSVDWRQPTNTEMVIVTIPHRHDLESDNPIHLETALVNAFIQELAVRYGTRPTANTSSPRPTLRNEGASSETAESFVLPHDSYADA